MTVHEIKGFNATGDEIIVALSSCLSDNEIAGDIDALNSYLINGYADWLSAGWRVTSFEREARQEWTMRVNSVASYKVTVRS